ncbi:MAG: archaeosine biosynthesis radical SAM protein RaSEA [Candidatus Thermoplasmatota archaeon]|nr:archaeosine biosynthesis radical SAM protein RaSEA [Candidatus Thermoplasmatota archaeon]
MKQLAEFCSSLKTDFIPKQRNPSMPVRCWSEKDVLEGNIVDAYVIIFRTEGCSWALQSGCTMCGYFNDSRWDTVSDEHLLTQFGKAMEGYHHEPLVKIFTSGSFLDDNEIPSSVQQQILQRLFETASKVSVESRPEFVTSTKLSVIKKIAGNKTFEVGIGLETANDELRECAINKGFTFADYKKAATLLHKHGFLCKTYVLIKPPFLTEKEAINDCMETVKKISSYTDTISFNPTNVQRRTLVEYLWKRKQYRPVWLWSVIDILTKSAQITKARIKCDVAGGGSIRGAHNCKTCDRNILDHIAVFSLSNDLKEFADIDCSCKQIWLDHLNIEDLGFGSLITMGE